MRKTALDFGSQFYAQAIHLVIVIGHRFVKFGLGFLKKTGRHGFKYLASTSFASRAVVSPRK